MSSPRRAIAGRTAGAAVWLWTAACLLFAHLAVSQYVFDNWQIQQGLPQNSVEALARTPDGYLWLATHEGLVRFDGVRFTVFDRDNTPLLRTRVITRLHVDDDGRLWIGTRVGVLTFAQGQFKAYDQPGLRDGYVRAIVHTGMTRDWSTPRSARCTSATTALCGLRRTWVACIDASLTASSQSRSTATPRRAAYARCSKTKTARSGSAPKTAGCCAEMAIGSSRSRARRISARR
jgi:hypothetical protein